MRSTEIRIFATLLVAPTLVAVGTYSLVLTHEPLQAWTLARGAIILVGMVTCVALAHFALRREWRADRRRLLDQAQSAILAEQGQALPLPHDGQLEPLVNSVRQYVEDLRARASQLQVQCKSLEIQLRLADAERRQSQTLINGISDAVLVTNDFDELIGANPVAAQFFGFDLASSSRRPIAELLGANRLVHDITEMRQNHARTNRRTTEHVLRLDGSERTFAVTMSSVTDSTDRFSSIVTVLHDATRENEISRMKNEFVSHVSHELRTPLSSIKAYAELLVDGEAGDEPTRQEFYHVIQGEADRLSRLIDNILNISRIESGMSKVTKKPLNLTGILKDVLEVARPAARENNISLVDQIHPVFSQVEADRDMIYQAALNLVSNAIKYTPAGGTVKVTVEADEVQDRVTLLVSDTGVGIPADAMKHLFEKFYRVEQHKNMAKGSGLGLNLTRQIVEVIHKGKMVVRSEPGKGSTFGFTLPIAP